MCYKVTNYMLVYLCVLSGRWRWVWHRSDPSTVSGTHSSSPSARSCPWSGLPTPPGALHASCSRASTEPRHRQGFGQWRGLRSSQAFQDGSFRSPASVLHTSMAVTSSLHTSLPYRSSKPVFLPFSSFALDFSIYLWQPDTLIVNVCDKLLQKDYVGNKT